MISRSKRAYENKFEEKGFKVEKSDTFLTGGEGKQETEFWILKK
jgi:hypothetical protein